MAGPEPPSNLFIAIAREDADLILHNGYSGRRPIPAARSPDAACRLRYYHDGQQDVAVLRVWPHHLVLERAGVGFYILPARGQDLHIPAHQLRPIDLFWRAEGLDEPSFGGFHAVQINLRDRPVVVVCCHDEKHRLAQNSAYLMSAMLNCNAKDVVEYRMPDWEWEYIMDKLSREPAFSYLGGFQCCKADDNRARSIVVGIGVAGNATQRQRAVRMAITLTACIQKGGPLHRDLASSADFMQLLDHVAAHVHPYEEMDHSHMEDIPPATDRGDDYASGEADDAAGRHFERLALPAPPPEVPPAVPPARTSAIPQGTHRYWDNMGGAHERLAVDQIRYSVAIVSDRFSDGRPLEELIDALYNGVIDPLSAPFMTLEVVSKVRHGYREYFTSNNKRLRCLKRYQDKCRHTRWQVWVNVRCITVDENADLGRYFERFDPKWDGDHPGLDIEVIPAPPRHR